MCVFCKKGACRRAGAFSLPLLRSDHPPRFDVILPSLRADLFDNGVVGGGVQDIVVAEIEGDVPDAFDARLIIARRVCEKDQVAAGYLGAGDVFVP